MSKTSFAGFPSIALAGFALLGFAGGCGSSSNAPTERLWVSGVPTSTRAEISAFVTTRTGEGKFLGAFFSGSLLRGKHDVFEWEDDGADAAKLKFLQDGKVRRIRIEPCKPSTGFDRCILVHGDPTGKVRYQSRKRWTVKRPGGKKDLATLVPSVMAELGEEDRDLAAFTSADVEPIADAP